jgi:parallel beta helix pectate lyase-like protein
MNHEISNTNGNGSGTVIIDSPDHDAAAMARPAKTIATRRSFIGAIAAAAGAGAMLTMPNRAKAATSSTSSPLLVYLADYSPVGDGTTDDTTPVSNALSAAAGKTLVLEEGKTYIITQALTVSKNTTILGKGSSLKFVVSSSVRNLLLRDHVTITNLTVENSGSSPSGAGDYQCPIVIGDYSSGTGYSGITLRDIILKSNRSNGNGMLITGDSHDIVVDGVTMISATSLGRGILMHWGGAGTLETTGTKHPHNIQITNVVARDMTYAAADAAVIFISGGYNIEVSNVDAHNVYRGVSVFAGDNGDEYATAIQKGRSGYGIEFSNIVMRSVTHQGVKIAGKGSLAGDAQAWPVRMTNCSFVGISGSANGVTVQVCDGPVFVGCKFSHFDGHGVAAGKEPKRVKFIGCEVSHCGNNGFYCSIATGGVEDWSIIDTYIHDNNTHGNTNSAQSAGIYLGITERPIILGCRFGSTSGETQKYGICAGSSCVSPKLEDNHVYGVASGGVGYSIGSSTDYRINAHGGNNTAAPGITAFGGAPIFTIDDKGNRIFRASAAPSGTWVRGDRVYNTSPSSGGTVGWVCVAAPSTWQAFGTIA